jgi:hypothetical protein
MGEAHMPNSVSYIWAAGFLSFLVNASAADALVVTQDTNGTDLLNALVPNQAQFTSISASLTPAQQLR